MVGKYSTKQPLALVQVNSISGAEAGFLIGYRTELKPTARPVSRFNHAVYCPHYRTNGSPVWKPECLWRTRRRSGGIFTSVRLCTSLWAGLGEGAFAHAGFQRRRSSNLASCPPTPFGSGERASKVFGACHAIEPSYR